jgi:hypothetical protein
VNIMNMHGDDSPGRLTARTWRFLGGFALGESSGALSVSVESA